MYDPERVRWVKNPTDDINAIALIKKISDKRSRWLSGGEKISLITRNFAKARKNVVIGLVRRIRIDLKRL